MEDRKAFVRNILRLVLLAIAFGSAIGVVAIIITLKGKFDGTCVILSPVKENSGKPHILVEDTPGSCSFLIKYQGSACAVSCMWFIYQIIRLVIQSEYRRLLPWKALVSVIYALLGLISACILHVALFKFCNELEEFDPSSDPACKHFEYPGVWVQDTDKTGVNFIALFHSAQVTSWISFIAWSILCVTYVIQMRSTEILPQRFENVVT